MYILYKVTNTRLLAYITNNGKKSTVKFSSTVLKIFKSAACSGNIISHSNGFYVVHCTEEKITLCSYDSNSHLIDEKEELLNGVVYPYSNLIHFNNQTAKLLYWGNKNAVFQSIPSSKQTASTMLCYYPNYELFAIKYVGNLSYAFEIGETAKSAHSILIGAFDITTLKVLPSIV